MSLEPTYEGRSIDPCPRCGSAVEAVEAINGPMWCAQPCGHRVAVTLHADRIELHTR